MKLSWKFCIIAYVVVLLSTGIGSALLVQNSIETVWNSQMDRVTSSEDYAISSFLSFANISSGKITDQMGINVMRQIESTLDSSISEFSIISAETVSDSLYLDLQINEGVTRFLDENDRLIMESSCKVSTANYEYIITLKSDFSELQHYRSSMWKIYSLTVFSIAIICSILLYFLTTKATKPLNILTAAANEITAGNYGKTVDIQTTDIEISTLSESFNTMSHTMENALAEIQKEVEKREAFIANFTHEMKTPMTAIIGYAEMLKSYELSEKEKRLASVSIYHEGKRLEQLSQQLLQLFITLNEEIQLMPTNLLEIQNTLEETLKMISEKYHVSCQIHLPNVQVLTNSILLQSLLYNLADNAFKASYASSTIKIFAIPLGEKIRIVVRDYGHGIAPEHIEHLTEAFYREDAARSRKQGGAGLGLALCKEIAALHSTELFIKSEPNLGTTVSFELSLIGEHHE